MLYIKYLTSLWSKKIGGQIISFLYTIPVIFFVICSMMSNFLPIVSNLLFRYNSQYNYSYTLPCSIFSIEHRENIKNPIAYHYIENYSDSTLLLIDSAIVSAGIDESVSDIKYEKISSVKLYVAKREATLNNTIFSNNNFIDDYDQNKVFDDKSPKLFLTYNTVNYLDLNFGANIEIDFLNGIDGNISSKYIGALKPEYNGTVNSENNSSVNNSFTEYNQYSVFNALLIVDETMFNKIAESDSDVLTVVYSDKKLDFSNFGLDTNLISSESKSDYYKLYKKAAMQKKFLVKSIFQCLVLSLVVIAINILELSFFKRKNKGDLMILSMLGMKKQTIHNIVITDVILKFILSTLIAVLLCKFVYFKYIFNMYCDNLLLFIISAYIVFIGIIYILVRGLIFKIFYKRRLL